MGFLHCQAPGSDVTLKEQEEGESKRKEMKQEGEEGRREREGISICKGMRGVGSVSKKERDKEGTSDTAG